MIIFRKGRQALLIVALAGLVLSLVSPAQATAAAGVANFAQLSVAFSGPDKVGGKAALSADMSQGTQQGNLLLANGQSLQLDLAGHDLRPTRSTWAGDPPCSSPTPRAAREP